MILLVKSWVRPHTRRLPDGRVVQVAGHQDRRTHQQEANPHQRELDLEVANNPAGPRSSPKHVGAAPSPRSAPNRAEGGAPTHREDPQLAALLKLYAGDEEVTPEELREAVRQYREVEARYRGTPQWLKAPNGEPSRLNKRQWVLVRTPNFKRWFGDWELAAHLPIEVAVLDGTEVGTGVLTWREASEHAKRFQNHEYVNADTGQPILVSGKGIREAAHVAKTQADLQAFAAIPDIIRNAVPVESSPDRLGRYGIKAVHTLYAPVRIAGVPYRARLIVRDTLQGGRYYGQTLESLELEKPSVVGGEGADAAARVAPRPLGSTITIAELLRGVREVGAVSQVVDPNGEPLVVYHGTTRAGFSVFHARSHFGTLPSASQRLETQADLRERRAAGHRQRIERGGEAAERARNALDRLEAGKSLEVGAADAIYQVFLNLRRPLDAVDAFDTREPFAEDWEDELRAAEARRYDGVRYRNAVEDRGSVSWLVMRPQDVKSAIGNAGTFRPDLGHVNKAILFFARTR